jgi:alpha-tubulin suppressor-like RCC1 family protein
MAGQLWAFGNNASAAFMQPTSMSSPVQTITGGTNWNITGAGWYLAASTKTDGTLWLWGINGYGSLGNNSIVPLDSPVQTVSFGTNWSYVKGGSFHCVALKTDGTLWTWGYNLYGQLGDNAIIHRSSPAQTITGGTNWSSASAGGLNTAAIKTDGTLWLWGENYQGALGDNTNASKSSPVQTVAFGTNWSSVSCGNGFTAAIKTDGTLWMCGQNSSGQLGDNTRDNKSSPVQTIAFGTNWSSVSSVGQFAGAIKKDGTLWMWGRNINGQLGDNTNAEKSSPVQAVGFATNWSKVACGGNHTAAIKTDGTLWLWGNNYGALGDNTAITKISSPVQTIAGGTNWNSVACGYSFTVATKTDGTLWTWGSGSGGQLGIDKYYKYSPSMVDSQTNWLTANSSKHTGFKAAIKTDGTLWLWGTGTNGQLGNNTVVGVISPVQTISDGTNWRSFSTGGTFCAATKTDGTLWTWGNNNNGYLGDGTRTSRSSPVQTATYGNNWNYVDCGQQHTAAIKTDGTLWMWGRNQFGNLGDNTALNKSSPIQTFAFGNNWQTVSCNLNNVNAFTAAIKTDGTLWMWGRNLSGQLGDNTITNKSSPIQTIARGTNWSSVACGNAHIAAIKTDGTLWTWGTGGTLGDGTSTPRSSPVQTLAGGTDWVNVKCGTSHTLATKKDGTIWGWGVNTDGQLNGTGSTIISPIQVISSSTTWYDIQASANNNFFILENNPNKLDINIQPQAGTASNQLIVQPKININDSVGNVVRTATNSVSVAVQSGSATISGTTTVTAVSGVATFTDLVLTGSGYIVLRFTSSGLTSADSMSFTVNIFLPIIPKRSEASGKLPTSSQLNIGELAVNITDKKGYVKKSDGTIVNLFNGAVYDGGAF